jgi:predicted DCC family thiol-disulfide oxidoreductase YuxK
MCTRLSHALVAWDRHHDVEIVASQTPGVTARFPWIPAQAYNESIQLIGPSGETTQGAAAIERLLGILPRGRWIAWVFRVPGVRGLAERVYRWVARNRYHLGCNEHCQSRSAPPGTATVRRPAR